MKIAFIGDLHYPTMVGKKEEVKEARDEFYIRFHHSFFNIKADYYVSIGDLTNFGREDELTEVYDIIKKYNKPFIHTFGNHDLYGIPREEVLKISNSEQNITIETEHANLISLETARDLDHENYSGYLSTEQLDWLSQEVGKNLYLFLHIILFMTRQSFLISLISRSSLK